MTKHIEFCFYIIERINALESLLRVFDLIHDHYSRGDIPKYFKSQEEVFESRINLHIVNVSYVYSFFDKKGIDIRKMNRENLSRKSSEILDEIVSMWKLLEKPITQIRHNQGFHGGVSSQTRNLLKVGKEIDENKLIPMLVELFYKLSEFSKQLEQDLQLNKA